ncbi:sugar ABC transporter permease, partial [Pseudomonas sp. BGM005]|nr:sugar ABC transporter permease [Pseudomonas sp. BG5]
MLNTREATDEVVKTAPPATGRRRTRSVGRSLWWMAVPAFAVFVYVLIVPSVQGIGAAFTNWSFAVPEADFVGFDNFIRAVSDENIRGPLISVTIWTFVFALLSV